jgi:nitroreductase
MTASFVVLTVADYAAYMWRYRHARALRNLYVDCGRANHDVMLAALSLDLHSFCTPALRDGDVDQALGIDGRRFHAIYSVSYGSERTDGRHD